MGSPLKSKETIIGEKKDGGLKMCDFKIMEKALKIAWVKRIQDESQASWKIIQFLTSSCTNTVVLPS